MTDTAPLASGLATCLVHAQATLGECVLWCEREQRLYWCDIEAGRISRCAEDGTGLENFQLPERVGSFALCEDGRHLLLGLAGGVALYELATRQLGPILPVQADLPGTRINDGRCDHQGRFVFGTFHEARGGAPLGAFFRASLDAGGSLQVQPLPLPAVTVANSIAFSPDGSRLYFADSPTRRIMCVDYHADGRLGSPRLFAEVPAGQGYPDGSAVDAGGGLWNAQWEAGRVQRYDAEGRPGPHVQVPARRVTCPAFGGAGLDRLFITSARIGLAEDVLAHQPLSGGVFEAVPGWQGLPERRFGRS